MSEQIPTKVTITFQSHNKITRVPPGMTIFNAASWIGLAIDSTCGAHGTCGKCKVRILRGYNGSTAADHKAFSKEELADGWRLSCRAKVHQDVVCDVPRLMGNPKAALMGFGRHVILDPNVHKLALQLSPPSLNDQRSDVTRITDALVDEGFDVRIGLPVMRQLPQALRAKSWRVTTVIVGEELIGVEPGDTTSRSYGLAFDIGTTTVVGALMDLRSGAPLAVRSTLNDQAIHGADVISRISYAMIEENGLAELSAKITQSLNTVIEQLLAQSGVPAGELYEVVVAGNATMIQLLLGIDPTAIGVEPFIPTVDDALDIKAVDVGLRIHPQAPLHCLPHLGAYVGADLMGGLLATGLAQAEGVRLLVDVGTNGEIILGSVERTVATAAPAGPAFEGAQIKNGMRASDGAIEAVTITPEAVQLQVIGDTLPLGLCGSGLLDAVAQLRLAGLLLASGRFEKADKVAKLGAPGLAERLISDEAGNREFVLAWGHESGNGQIISLSQRDIRELQFAKTAIASGIDVVMSELGVTQEDLVEIYLAGSFGNYINPQSARIIGLVPPVPVERIKAVGNASGEGAKMALLSFRERQIARSLPQIVEYHELSVREDFNDSFISILQFPKLADLGLEPTIAGALSEMK
jgi:uncharacterized 2Fe-2S/4Fe-4S cluster protein (DUF4445 family)